MLRSGNRGQTMISEDDCEAAPRIMLRLPKGRVPPLKDRLNGAGGAGGNRGQSPISDWPETLGAGGSTAGFASRSDYK